MSVIKCRHPELQPALTLTGALEVPCHWDKLKEKTWNREDPSPSADLVDCPTQLIY